MSARARTCGPCLVPVPTDGARPRCSTAASRSAVSRVKLRVPAMNRFRLDGSRPAAEATA